MSELNSQTVLQLKALAKSLGLRGYSRLRKAELIAHIKESTKDDYEGVVVDEEEEVVVVEEEVVEKDLIEFIELSRSRGIDNFIEEEVAEIAGGALLDDPIPKHEIPKGQKIMKTSKAAKIKKIKKIKKIDKVVKWGKKKVEDWGKWLKEIDVPRVVVDDELKDFKAHIAKLYKRDEHHFNLVERKSLKKHIGKM
ncbi:hypothetical protein AWC38_SpisGene25680, partial [Stylophora pistillata]